MKCVSGGHRAIGRVPLSESPFPFRVPRVVVLFVCVRVSINMGINNRKGKKERKETEYLFLLTFLRVPVRSISQSTFFPSYLYLHFENFKFRILTFSLFEPKVCSMIEVSRKKIYRDSSYISKIKINR